MILGICIVAIGLALLGVRVKRRERPMPHDDVVRLSLYSERVRREELFPFVE